ncbi:hypothetical protein D3C75_544790 [compost metagenome]
MGFPHRGLLRKLRQPVRHQGHAPLTSVTDPPRFTCLDSDILRRRLPVALFILACRKLAEVSNASVIDAAAPVFRIHVKTTFDQQVHTYYRRFLLHHLSNHVGRGDVFSPQRRINGFMLFSLSALNLEDHLGLVISPHSPLSAGYITLRACRRSLTLRFSNVTPGGIVGLLIVS